MPPTAQENLKTIAARYKLDTIYVFGSRAMEIAQGVRGESKKTEHPDSDVDIGVQPGTGSRLSAKEKVGLAFDLEELFRVQRVDLVVIPEAGPFLALDIIQGEIIYCKNLDEEAESELFILRRAGDLAPYERIRREQVFSESDK